MLVTSSEPAAVPADVPEALSHLTRYGVTFDEIDELVAENPSLRSFVVGYVAERRLRAEIHRSYPGLLVDAGKPDDHDRTAKGDRRYRYGDLLVRLESKSLQTSTVTVDQATGAVSAKFQCDGSDRRPVVFSDGSTVETTCLRVGEFDIVAVNLFEAFDEWRFAYAANRDLPRTRSGRYSAVQRAELLATTVSLTVAPTLSAPFTWDLAALVRRLAGDGRLPAWPQAGTARV